MASDDGGRVWISIPGIFEGQAGRQGGVVSFRPSQRNARPGRYAGEYETPGNAVTFSLARAPGWHVDLHPFLNAPIPTAGSA